VYVGHSKYGVDKRWKQHCKRAQKTKENTPFSNAIRKYELNDWECSTLEVCDTSHQAKTREVHYIQQFGSYHNGYNATLGGDGNNGIVMSQESNEKRSRALKGVPKNYDRMHGKRHSPDTILKMRKPKLDKSAYQTSAFKDKMRATQAKAAKDRRVLTKQQYDQIYVYITKGFTKKEVARLMSLNYDIVKKWSRRPW
jgi:group I intron endonuclease